MAAVAAAGDDGDQADVFIPGGRSQADELEYVGLESIDRACLEIYPDQPNPLQATAVVKLWLGGPDPLDYISMYSNPGDPDRAILPHWHYVSYGFSDLHGDSRVHPISGPGQPSGFGFELTFRLKKEDDQSVPPMWPSNLMNKLATYVFQTGNVLQVGDHIPWHCPLDGGSNSLIQHMLITSDPQIPDLDTPYGFLQFRQIVGVKDDELKAAQKWKGAGVLELMCTVKEIGPHFITDMSRTRSIFEMDSNLLHRVTAGIEQDGSNLGHVTAVCSWSEISAGTVFERGTDMVTQTPSVDGMDTGDDTVTLCPPETLEAVHLKFDAEAAELLPLIVKARLQKGRFFVFHNAENYAIHLIPPSCQEENQFVSQGEPLKAQGTFLQIYCSEALIDKMSQEFEMLQDNSEENQEYPIEFRFSDPTIVITVSPRGQLCCDL
ncbi:suppressor of fused homolog [Mizuhopecten yessoensis]|uniref:suppressor of fused homolog n=1 Tax=Mizuhopecten yessoensis TaxID=6573 RepID=UPI000B459F66|nr:suppressor of fused homolog [Mizuhopecten yessoensis]